MGVPVYYSEWLCSCEKGRHVPCRVALFVDDYHNGDARASVCVWAETPSYMSYYDVDDDNDVPTVDYDSGYQPLFRLERFTHSFTRQTLEVCTGNGNSRIPIFPWEPM